MQKESREKFPAFFSPVINRIYDGIRKNGYAARRRILRAGRLFPEDVAGIGLAGLGLVNDSYSARAEGTKRTHAGSIGGLLLRMSERVPAFLATSIFSGTRQRET